MSNTQSSSTVSEDLTLSGKGKEIIWYLVSTYQRMGLSIRKFLMLYLLPSIGLGIGLLAFSFSVSGPLSLILQLSAISLPFLVLMYPVYIASAKSNEIDENFHLFITHLTTLSLTNTSRVGLFRTIAEEDSYGALSNEVGRLVGLVDTWNMSLDDACRVRSNKSSSEVLSDFYEQVAYNVGAGQPMSDFLINEQEAFINAYATTYEANMDRVEFISDL